MSSKFSTDTRANSYTLGTALILAIAFTATIGTAVSGFYFVDQSQQNTRISAAEQSMTKLDSETSLVALGEEGQTRTVDMGLSEKERITVKDTGRVKVEALNPDNTVNTVILNKTTGTAVYSIQGTERTVAYQGGGVWKNYGGNESTMVSPPEFRYKGETLTFPLMTLNVSKSDKATGTNQISVTRVSSTPAFPTETKKNPIQSGKIRVSITSKYYQGWSEFFRTRVGGDINIDHSNETVSVTLQPPPDKNTVTSGLLSTASGTGINIRGSGGSPSFIDSYNSTNGNYTETASNNGNLTASSDVTMRGSAKIYGNVIIPSAYNVDARGGSTVTGEIYNEPVKSSSANERVQSEVIRIRGSNDNDATTTIQAEQLNSAQNTWTLTAGKYYIDGNLDIGNGEELVLDTTGGEVKLAVSGDVTVDGGDITVTTGTEKAKIYILGDQVEFRDGTATVPDDDSARFWIYAKSGLDTSMRSGSSFTGVIYAPDGDSTSGTIDIRSQSEVFGGVVGGSANLQSGGTIHYDQGLKGTTVFDGNTVPPVTYLHVTVNDVKMED